MKQFRLLTLLALLMTAATGAWAQTDVSTFAQLQSALDAGNDVRLTSNISFTSAITISGSKKITINGNGKTLSGPSTRAFTINSGNTLAIKNATLNNFDLNAGGGAIRNNGTLVLDGCTVSNNHTDGSNQGGGAIENQGTLYASNTTFSGNYSSEIGGAINNYMGKLYLSDCTFINNYTTSSNAKFGGAIGNNSSNTVVIVNCTFSGNKYNGSNGSASDLGVYRTPNDYTIAGCTGITITGGTLTTYQYGTATPDYSDLSNIKFDYQKSDTPIAAPAVPKHLITATYREQTRLLEQPLPYATTIGELYEAVTGESFSDLISTMSAFEMPLTGISSNNTSVVSIGELNGASTPVTVNADGKATVSLNFSGYAHGIFVSVISPLYAYMKDGVKDADKWTVKVGEGQAQALPIGGLKGDGSETVTLQYTGRLKVKGVKATSDAAPAAGKTVDLSTLTADYEAKDGDVLTGTLANNVKISIAAGATVKLKDATINGGDDYSYKWAGLNCAGDATITLEGTNMVKGFYADYPGIQVPMDKTLTIQGTGSLNARSNGYAAGIGGGYKIACGNIVINSGTIEATGGWNAAGIGGGHSASCGNITINGGTVTATGGNYGAGIGGGRNNGACGTITITSGVTSVTATKGSGAPYSIGKGTNGTCGTVTIGGVEGAITTSPYTYDPTAPAAKPAATVTTAPTGAAIVGVGKTTALVSGGVADGGTLMYAVTTTNTKPTSTAGFSDAVPTAQTITASGKVYVWYYVKADDTHSDSEIAATAIEVPVADIVWDVTNVSDLDVWGTDHSYTKEGVTLSGNAEDVYALWNDTGDPTTDGISFQVNESGGFTFTAPTGKKFTKIEMTLTGSGGWMDANLGTGWAFNFDSRTKFLQSRGRAVPPRRLIC